MTNAIQTFLIPFIEVGVLIISIFTLCEIKKERRLSYQPKIIFKKELLYLQKSKDLLHAIWKDTFDDIYTIKENPKKDTLALKFFNAGLGPALDVDFTWKFDKKLLEKAFIDLAEKYSECLSFNKTKNEVMLRNSSSSSGCPIYQDNDKVNIKVPCLLSYKEESFCFVQIPESFSLLLSIFSLLNLDTESFDEIAFPIPLSLKISYRDTGNKEYNPKKTFHFSFIKMDGLISHHEKKYGISPNYAICLISNK